MHDHCLLSSTQILNEPHISIPMCAKVHEAFYFWTFFCARIVIPKWSHHLDLFRLIVRQVWPTQPSVKHTLHDSACLKQWVVLREFNRCSNDSSSQVWRKGFKPRHKTCSNTFVVWSSLLSTNVRCCCWSRWSHLHAVALGWFPPARNLGPKNPVVQVWSFELLQSLNAGRTKGTKWKHLKVPRKAERASFK